MSKFEQLQCLHYRISRPLNQDLTFAGPWRCDICGDVFSSIRPSEALPDADKLANFIRQIDGSRKLGASALAELICEWLLSPQHGDCGSGKN